MSSSVRGGGGELTMYLKHCDLVSGIARRDKLMATYIQTLAELLLLFVYNTESEVDLVGLLKVGLHLHDLRECLLGVVQRPVPVVQDANPVPQLRFLFLVSNDISSVCPDRYVPWGFED